MKISDSLKRSVPILSLCIATCTAMTVSAQEEEIKEEVIVTGVRQAILNAQDLKRNATEIIEAVTFEDVGKYTDENLAETLQRVPGLQIDRHADGSGRFVSIRGLGPKFNKTTVNGRSISGGAGGPAQPSDSNLRSFDFSVVPPELSGGVRISKSPSANMDEGGIGGTVDIQTLRPLDIKQDGNISFNGTVNATYRDSPDAVDPRVSALLNYRVNDNLGVLLNVSTSETSVLTQEARIIQTQSDETILGRANVLRPGANTNYSASEEEKENTGINLTAQFRPNDDLNIVLDYGSNTGLRKVYQNTYQFKLTNGPNNMPLLPPPTLLESSPANIISETDFQKVKGILLAGVFNGESSDSGSYTYSTYDRDDSFYGLNVEYNPNSGPLTLNFDYAHTESAMDRDNRVATVNFRNVHYGIGYFLDTQKNVPIFAHLIGTDPDTMEQLVYDPTDPSSFALNQVGFNVILVENESDAIKFDLDYEVDFGPIKSLEFGVKREELVNESLFNNFRFGQAQRNTALGLAEVEEKPLEDFITDYKKPGGGFLGEIPLGMREWITFDGKAIVDYWTPIISREGVTSARGDEFPSGGWQVHDETVEGSRGRGRYLFSEETVDAAYVQFNFDSELGNTPIRGNFGVRYIDTNIDAIGYRGRAELGESSVLERTQGGYSDLLPSLNITFELREDLLVRLAASKVMARPEISQISGSTNFDAQERDNVVDPACDEMVDPNSEACQRQFADLNINIKNPNLDPFEADQIESIIEWYPGDKGASVSAGVFYKDIITFPTTIDTEFTSYEYEGTTYNSGDTVTLFNPNNGRELGEFVINDIKERLPQNIDEGATINGFELQGHLPFNVFAEDIAGLNNIGFRASYTKLLENESGVNDPITGEKLPLEGASEDNYSSTLYYDDGTIAARLNFTHRGRALRSPRTQGGALFDEPHDSLSGNINYTINDNMSVRFSMSNILGEANRQSFIEGAFPYAYRQPGKSYTLAFTYKTN